MKIISIIGARPQFIKSSIIDKALYSSKFNHIIVHTGQHFDYNMNDIFFDELKISPPKYNLDISSLSHGAMVGNMLIQIEKILLIEKPDLLIVYGDTNSTIAGALAAKKLNIKIAHIEAGLRSYNINMPEEQNRILTDKISDFLFCPSQNSYEILTSENIHNSNYGQKAYITGDVMIDSLLLYKNKTQNCNILHKLNITNKKFVLCTIHRPENTDNKEKLKTIFDTLEIIAKNYNTILPLHPRTQKKILEYNFKFKNIKITEPVSYFEMLNLQENSKFIITDSGGIQKEAYFFKKPCITIREETEWTELLDIGVNFLTGSNKQNILNAYALINNINSNLFHTNIYGDGQSAKKIVNILSRIL